MINHENIFEFLEKHLINKSFDTDLYLYLQFDPKICLHTYFSYNWWILSGQLEKCTFQEKHMFNIEFMADDIASNILGHLWDYKIDNWGEEYLKCIPEIERFLIEKIYIFVDNNKHF